MKNVFLAIQRWIHQYVQCASTNYLTEHTRRAALFTFTWVGVALTNALQTVIVIHTVEEKETN